MYNIKDSVFETKKMPIRVVEKGDQLSIFVSSVNTELANTFNMPVTLGGTNSSGFYWVDDEGQITMTKIGLITVAGLTYKSLKDTLENKLKYYFKLYCSSFCFLLTTYFMCKNIFNRLFCVIELNLVSIRSQYLKQIHFRF